ncbi:hypothetical protein [Candidatus Uabimicrobium amorphum]|uniref:Chromosome partition protein Smc n=1 Tax=Uabimicrobium amorphum TaxID=2596890 RepID=A0A5S9F5P0_UABAM|nr:hypothetical protein [Candidatus Uabimicrobium amorphum]BBM86521.1 chromosome partition protein Smc [Candidatus Uabimicrobium amorphum]
MRFVFCIMMLFFSHTILAESYQIFITKIKVSAKNNGKYWDTFKGAPDIQVVISKRHNDEWKKIFVSQVFTNHHIVDEHIVVPTPVEENDEIIIYVVDRDFRRNDNIGSQMLTVKESEKTVTFSMVEELQYVITKYSSLEEKRKASENKRWEELQQQKKAAQQKKIDEREKWRTQMEKERKAFSEELQQQKKIMLEEAQAEITAQKTRAKELMEKQQKSFNAAWEKKRADLRREMEAKFAAEQKQKKEQLAALAEQIKKISEEFNNRSQLYKKKMDELKQKNTTWKTQNEQLQKKIEKQQQDLQQLQKTIDEHKKMLQELQDKIEKVQKQAMFQGATPKKMSPRQMARAMRAMEFFIRRMKTPAQTKVKYDTRFIVDVVKNFTHSYKKWEKTAKLYAQK